ncbi:Holliday junction branch migration protein RuvA [Corynebacterium pseudotuberculosis]|uniref:Holliday junction branch migration complex subunit RuvA n=2 Tax=Corynebacterium pseudotuberculosis TaxID=1719 RepID=D9QAS2_CORP2|nr:Holliday junction branch migration protein RuvA [Corynebacterium pseudotuberculosis]AER69224.1 Holliday junction ATP-dependent DNA helicase ruvA [Corynebacterium pseudotuberculosis 1/06-A]ADK28970.1 Holliday junction branch migration protein RuvA [Corynebacterium pseudotuberculosis FRC41]ADL10648.1 Holliday junction branch migration protein RuvA [Corynebacterium pseudotuberculosis C231]ADL21057.1 Holliday junction branch migration protein RuvA [Corynebacterium pseudotuberculosis 1002]ADO264
MIVSLRGTVASIGLGSAVIECNGVGYEVLASPSTLSQMRRGEEFFVLTTMVVREDSQTLYGFASDEARQMFTLLQTVSGLGPKLALAAQSVLSAVDLAQAIANQDAKTLQRIPGVGKRVAERIIVDLKDKVSAFITDGGATPASGGSSSATSDVSAQVLEALLGLGFTEKVAEPALNSVLSESPNATTSQALRLALSTLGKKK